MLEFVLGRLIILLNISWMYMIWLNIDMFSWIFVLKIVLSLRAVIMWTLLHFYVSCWLDVASRNWWSFVGSFILMLRIYILVLFLARKAWFNGILIVDWDIYDILWCSQYCARMPIWLPIGGKLTVNSNISYLMKGWS